MGMNIYQTLLEAQQVAIEQHKASIHFIEDICGEFEEHTQISPRYYGK